MSTVISCSNISKTYRSGSVDIPVLRKVSLSVNAGESVGIRGESGSGKTTLLNVLAGIELPEEGSVSWDNKTISSKNRSQLAVWRGKWIGMVFQSFYLVPELNAYENVLLAARVVGRVGRKEKARAVELLTRVGLSERLKANVTQLSGGERQRVALARALMNEPCILLADEPTGNLDEKTGEMVMDLLLSLCEEEKRALVLVTHNADFAARTNRELFLHEGSFAKL